jgi:pyrroloquinoline quinone (PQQ) biosynthesis protein C
MEDLKTTDAVFPAAGATSLSRSLDHGGARERDFASGSPEVAEWSSYFRRRASAGHLFAGINECLGGGSRKSAVIVGANWLNFSTWLPSFLTLSAAKVADNLVRHYLIQIAFEELGGRKSDEIHCRLFAEAVAGIGIGEAELASAAGGAQSDIYDDFYEALLRAESTAEVLGLNLGVEIIAEENIETLFALLAYSDTAAETLNESVFFRMHRAIEEEHLRLSISNFLRFCGDDEDKRLFLRGFDKSIDFWRSFWNRNRLIISSAA